jgi:hypothetical protein
MNLVDRLEPATRLLTFLRAHRLPPQATALSILDQARAQMRDADDDDAWSIGVVILAKAAVEARRALDAGEDTEGPLSTVGTALRIVRKIGPARSMIPPGR